MERLNRLNTTTALKIVLLLGFAAFFCMTIFTGTVRLYVHPRIIPFMLFAAAAMLIIAALLCREIFSPVRSTPGFWSLLFFALPLLMALAIPPKTLDSSSGTTGSVLLISNAAAVGGASSAPSAAFTPASQAPGSTDTPQQALPKIETQKPSIALQNGVLVLNSGNFYAGLSDVYEHLDDYKGVPISLVGSVFKDNESFAENQFVPARLMMVCCAADMQPAGLLCQYDGASRLTVDSWVKVEGVIGETTFEGETIPYILARSITPVEAPAQPYIYPY